MNSFNSNKLSELFANYVSDHKKSLIEEVLSKRTRHLTVVLEDIYQPQNASATIRTCDCFGIQDLYVIEKKHKYEVNPRVVHGSSKWVDIHHYNEDLKDNLKACITKLRKLGYNIVGTTPNNASLSIYDLDIKNKTALIFGTELTGLSEEAKQYCDELVHIPMVGFTESFNISVSVAISLGYLTKELYNSAYPWELTIEQKDEIRLEWYKKIVPNAELMEKEFLKKIKGPVE